MHLRITCRKLRYRDLRKYGWVPGPLQQLLNIPAPFVAEILDIKFTSFNCPFLLDYE